jgi:hypothetical protein
MLVIYRVSKKCFIKLWDVVPLTEMIKKVCVFHTNTFLNFRMFQDKVSLEYLLVFYYCLHMNCPVPCKASMN